MNHLNTSDMQPEMPKRTILNSLPVRIAYTAAVTLLLTGFSGTLPAKPKKDSFDPLKIDLVTGLKFNDLEFTIPTVKPHNVSGGRIFSKLDQTIPLIKFSIIFPGGRLLEPASKLGLHDVMASSLKLGGSKKHPEDSLSEKLEYAGIELSVSSSNDSVSISVSCLNKDFNTVTELLEDLLKNPLYPQKVIDQVKKRKLEYISRRNDNPSSLASRKLTEVLYKGGLLGLSNSAASVNAVSRTDITLAHRRIFRKGHIDVLASGSLPSSFNQRIGALLKSLPQSTELDKDVLEKKRLAELKKSRWYNGQHKANQIYLVDKKVPQTTILMGSFSIRHGHPDYHSAKVMNHILGAGAFNARLFRIIRSDKGLAYSAYGYLDPGKHYGLFKAFAQTKTASTGQVLTLFNQIFTDYKSGGATQKELEWAKQSIINKFIFLFDDPWQIVYQNYELSEKDLPADFLSTFRDKTAAVSGADVLKTARNQLNTPRAIVVVGDKSAVLPVLKQFGSVQELAAD